MTTTEQNLPTEIQTALTSHEKVKANYLAIRERLVTLSERIEKHRKTATAARAEANAAGNAWRAEFRATDGQLTKEIRQLKRQELDSRELAEEYESLAAELQPEFDLCQLDTYDARAGWSGACEHAKKSYTKHCLDESVEKVFTQPDAQRFIVALERKGLILPAAKNVPHIGRRCHAEIEEENRATTERLLELGKMVQALICAAREKVGPATADPFWEQLQLTQRHEAESLPDQVRSPMFRNRRRKELEMKLKAG